MVEGRFTLPKSVDKIRVENKGLEVTGKPNATGWIKRGVLCEWGDPLIPGGVQGLRGVIYGTNVYNVSKLNMSTYCTK